VILRNFDASVRFDFSLLVGAVQRVIIRLLLKENANADDIHRRLQAQLTDDVDRIRSVRRWCQFIRQERENLHGDPMSGRLPIDRVDTKILPTLNRRPF
jgi:hypothetical protein